MDNPVIRDCIVDCLKIIISLGPISNVTLNSYLLHKLQK